MHNSEAVRAESVLDFRVPPEPRASRAVRESVSRFARTRGVGEDDLDHFLTALGEAIANAIEHGRSSQEALIHVEIRMSEDRIVATVQDHGCGFTPSSLAEPTLPDPNSERGRGLPIIRRCSDIFALTSSPGRGTAVVLGRYFQPVGGFAGVA